MATRDELLRRAEECLLDEDEEGALLAYTELLQEEPSSARAWADVGFILADLGRTDEAMQHFDRALELDPRCASAWVGRGMRLSGDEAIRCFDHAIAADPDSDSAWFLKSCVLAELGRPTEAASCLARARQLSPGTYG